MITASEIDGDLARDYTAYQEAQKIQATCSQVHDYVVVRLNGEVIRLSARGATERAKLLYEQYGFAGSENDGEFDEITERYAYGFLKDGVPLIAGAAVELYDTVAAELAKPVAKKVKPATG